MPVFRIWSGNDAVGVYVSIERICPKRPPIGKTSDLGSHRFEFGDKKGEFSCMIFQNRDYIGILGKMPDFQGLK